MTNDSADVIVFSSVVQGILMALATEEEMACSVVLIVIYHTFLCMLSGETLF